jgi:hypothetical protein
VIAKLRRNEEEPRLQDTQAGCDRNRVKIFNFDRLDSLFVVIDGDFEEIAILALKQEEECALTLH